MRQGRPQVTDDMTKREDQPLTGVHILIVDDNENARELLRLHLNLYGAAVTTVGSASEALGVLQEIQAHVIVSDLSMPGVDGFEFIKRVRALPGQAESPTPAIAFSGSGDEQHRRRALSSGFQLYVERPISPVTLTETIAGLAR
jgi:CheY-like chemotaxis protein